MKKKFNMQARQFISISVLALGLNGCAAVSTLSSAMSLYQMVGGSDVLGGLSSSLLSSAMGDPRLSNLLGSINPSTASPQITNQLCSVLGGGCAAPFSNAQVSAGAARLTAQQKSAVSDNLSSTLNAITSNPMIRDTLIKTLAPQMSGILGALL